jgi:hypothetical protein
MSAPNVPASLPPTAGCGPMFCVPSGIGVVTGMDEPIAEYAWLWGAAELEAGAQDRIFGVHSRYRDIVWS